MEGKMNDFVLLEVDSSELCIVRGGAISSEQFRQLMKLLAFLADFIGEYYPDFMRGFKKGWDMF